MSDRRETMAGTGVVLVAGAAALLAVGVNLGGAFALVTAGMVALPVVAERASVRSCAISSVAAALPAMVLSVFAAAGSGEADRLSSGQWLAIACVVATTAMAAGMMTRALLRLHLPAAAASGVAVVVSLLWLTWPVWLSPRLSGAGGEHLAALLVASHPLLAINGLAPQFGLWTQQAQMYRLTALGQDVNFSLPGGVGWCVGAHAVIAGVAVFGGNRRAAREGDVRA